LLDERDRVIDSINLSTEYDHLMAQDWINGGMRLKLGQIKGLLDDLPLSSSVSITRPAELARELFTHRGSGTLVRRGERVLRADAWDELDLPRLRGLVESSFGRTLVPDYFERTPLLRAYVSENYRTAVILADVNGVPYLDKFAVLDEAQGEGLGRAVWQVMREETPQLFWRSRQRNGVNQFYHVESDGCFRHGQWRTFWYGLDDFDAIRACVEHSVQRPQTLLEKEVAA
ncbi:MAG: acetylglutamate kinase, partial [Luteimonas sp.]